jgi:hypothetical protein
VNNRSRRRGRGREEGVGVKDRRNKAELAVIYCETHSDITNEVPQIESRRQNYI